MVAAPGHAGPGMFEDSEGLFAARYDATPGSFYLLRPDQHVGARWRNFDQQAVRGAVMRACGHDAATADQPETERQVELA